MSRDIKFQGKRIDDNEWVQGDLITETDGNLVVKRTFIHLRLSPIDFSQNSLTSKMCLHEIDPETVGQYTGLKDKNRVEIYEGDILRFPAKDWREERDFIGYEVFYHDNDCADNHVGFQMNRMRFYGNLCGGECRAKMLPKYTSQMLVLGNIYANPELLEAKHD